MTQEEAYSYYFPVIRDNGQEYYKSSLVYANTLLLTDYPNDLTDPAILDLVDYIQKNNSELIIRKTPFKINMVEIPDETFFKTLRNKLLWGEDKRN